MKVETLKERIAKAEEKINKKGATIDKKINWRLAKMAKRDAEYDPRERHWLDFEIESLSDDIDRLCKERDEAIESLKKYQDQLAKEIEKDASRNVKAILDFLDMWADRVYEHYETMFPKFLEANEEYHRKDREYFDLQYNRERKDIDRDEIRRKRIALEKAFHSNWNWIAPYVDRNEFDGEKLKKELEEDKKAKYDDMIERTNYIVGTITDASRLEVGAKGELNGIVIGERGKAKVETIGAGGYNIQCFHFRTLIREIK